MNFKKAIPAIFMVSMFLISCQNKESISGGFTTIKGTYDLTIPWPTQIVKLSKVEYGKHVELGEYKLNEDKKFGFTVASNKEGFYVLHSEYNQIPVYVKGDQVFNLSIREGNKYALTDIPDEENKVLYEYKQLTDTLLYYSIFSGANPATYKEFFPFYESFIPKMKAFHKKVNTSNVRFNELMHAYIDLDIIHQAEYFLQTPRPEHPTAEQIEELAPFYKDFVENDVLKTTLILDLPKGINALRSHDMFYVSNILKTQMADDPKELQTDEELKKGRALRRADFIKRLRQVQGSSITNDTLKAFYVLEELPRFKAYNTEYIAFMKPYRPLIELSAYTKTKVEAFEATIRNTGEGSPGVDFTYKDIKDNDVSFTDFRGKIVYIDVWATWCAPCKQEIPFLKELEEEFKGEDIVFVSISLDKPNVHKKWKKFVKEQELTGIQLFADNAFDSKIAKDYKISAIPRFMLFDKQGIIINADAQRPSDPDLKAILRDLLK